PAHHYTLSLHDALPIFSGANKLFARFFQLSCRRCFFYHYTKPRRRVPGENTLFGEAAYIQVYKCVYSEYHGTTVVCVYIWIGRTDRKSTRLNSSHLGIS